MIFTEIEVFGNQYYASNEMLADIKNTFGVELENLKTEDADINVNADMSQDLCLKVGGAWYTFYNDGTHIKEVF